MYRQILLAADGSPYSDWGRQASFQLLDKNGKINILHVVDLVALEGTFLSDLSGAAGAEPFFNLSPKLEKLLREKGETILELQADACKSSGFTCTTLLETGIVANEIAKRAIENDLVVIGRMGKNARFSAGLAGSAAEALLRKSPRPVLVVSQEPKPIKRVLAGFDGSVPAARALSEASRLCKEAGWSLTVLVAGDDSAVADRHLQEAKRYLEQAGHTTDYLVAKGKPEPLLTEEAAKYDLLVVGAHGHSRVVELVVGSTTEYLLRNSPVPTLFLR